MCLLRKDDAGEKLEKVYDRMVAAYHLAREHELLLVVISRETFRDIFARPVGEVLGRDVMADTRRSERQ